MDEPSTPRCTAEDYTRASAPEGQVKLAPEQRQQTCARPAVTMCQLPAGGPLGQHRIADPATIEGHAMRLLRSLPLLATLAVTAAFAHAQAGREQVPGVTNFGRVTDTFFRGGKVTDAGLEHLHAMGVRTVIDLRCGESGEEAAARRLGMQFHSFPMNGGERPDDRKVEQILTILRNAKEPVYVHCKGGRHRAGTIAALYRIRVQGWSHAKAWAEQESYGFGSPGKHPALHGYAYGNYAVPAAPGNAPKTDKQKKDHDRNDAGKAKPKSKDKDKKSKGKHSQQQ
jgi:protein tyrosine phosphatase (PTP) superfamily phosphohydrolase (DUF442 family)